MFKNEDFWKEQLTHAHAINALVDNHRFVLLQMFLAFHGLLLTALVFKPEIQISFAQNLTWLPPVLAVGVSFVGLTIFGTFFSQHVYMRTYKHWIGALEANLLTTLKLRDIETNHSGSLYWDDNTPYIPLERTLIFTLILFIILNLGVPALIALLLGTNITIVVCLFFVNLALHIICYAYIGRHPTQKPSQVIANRQLVTGYYAGNAIDIGAGHRGWFMGHFITNQHPLLRTPGIEIKWGIHTKGAERVSWDDGINSYSISFLVKGDFVITFKDAEYQLQREGDFVI